MEGLRLFVSHPVASTMRAIVAMVEGLGHEVVGTSTLAEEMVAECIAVDLDMIISGVQYTDQYGIDALIEISQHDPKPAIIVAQTDDLTDVENAMDDHVMAYLVDPVTPDDLRPMIYVVRRRFEEFQQLKEENASLREAMSARKLVERAKGLLMRRLKVEEDDAFGRLQRLAKSRRMKIKDIAEIVIELES